MLSIKSTCTLRGDFYHCLEVEWPNYFSDYLWNFGLISIGPLMRRALKGSRRNWNEYLNKAKEVVKRDISKFEFFESMHNNPSRHANWWHNEQCLNLILQGSIPVEQNHLAIKVQKRDSGTLFFVRQVQLIMSRSSEKSKQCFFLHKINGVLLPIGTNLKKGGGTNMPMKKRRITWKIIVARTFEKCYIGQKYCHCMSVKTTLFFAMLLETRILVVKSNDHQENATSETIKIS